MKRLELLLLAVHVPLDFILLLAAAASAYALRLSPYVATLRPVLFTLPFSDYLRLAGLVGLGWLALFAFAGLYTTDPNRRLASDFYKIFLACSSGLAGVALVLMFTQQRFDSRFLAAAGWAFAVCYVSFGRLLVRGMRGLLYKKNIGRRRVAIIGQTPVGDALADAFASRPGLGYTVVGRFSNSAEATARLRQENIDEVIYTSTGEGNADALRAIAWCADQQIVFKYAPDLFAAYATNISVHPVAGIPIAEIRRTRLDGWGRILKRLSDIVLGALCLVLASPIMAIAAMAILFETGRPVFYKNERVGAGGKRFFALKFRSMYQKDCTGPQFGASGVEALQREEELIRRQSIKPGPVYKIANDPRVTPVGRLLRRWSIDELPQLFNVLRGEMSLVGPRPHQPREVAQYETEHKKVLLVKPGITGLAQISGRSDLSFDEEVRLDVFYLEQWRLWLDAVIIFKTPFIVLKKRGAL
jgi:exopolysaccharide biosynthesis polyprenyl glycosylphosphotransferase